jgi:predicted Zn-dependent protease with MMP-like domain
VKGARVARGACHDGRMRSRRTPASASSNLRRVGVAALISLSAGLVVIVVAEGFSTIGAVRALEDVALGVIVVATLTALIAFIAVRLAGWRDPESESDFEEIVRHSEALAREGLAWDPDESDFLELDPLDDDDFEELVRDALDDLPDLLRNALSHVAVVISDRGRRRRAYGVYEGDGATRDHVHDRIVIFRDTLRRDFGHDAELLREQVVRTVRHELAHHVGFDELGVGRLDL